MQDFLLLISVAAFMVFGFFIADNIDKFLNKYYKGFEYDEEQDKENTVQKAENKDNLLL